MANEPIHEEDNETPAALAVEKVHFCRKSDCPRTRNADGFEFSNAHTTNRLLWLLVHCTPLLFAWVICLGLGKRLGINHNVCLACWLIVTVGILAYWIIPARRFARQLDRDNVPEAAPPDARLQCIGAPSELPQAVHLKSVPFEPHVYHFPLAAIAIMLSTVLFLPASYILEHFLASEIYSSLFMMLICLVAVMFRLRPLYFRISPGQLEVLRYGFFSRKASKVYRYDLRKARIVADLRRDCVFVYEDPESSHACYFALMPDRKEAMLMFFLAAVSEHETPELPEDAL